jgi:oxazoline/thiazoline dehydrogenase
VSAASEIVLGLRPEVEIDVALDGRVSLSCSWARIGLGTVAAGVGAALARLGDGGGTAAELVALAESDGPRASATLLYGLQLIERRAMVRHEVHTAAGLLARATPTTSAPLPRVAVPSDGSYQLTRFAVLRRGGSAMVLESPLTSVQVDLGMPLVGALVAALAEPQTAATLAAIGPVEEAEAALLLQLLVEAGVVEPAGQEEAGTELWEFQDLLLFTRSRRGRHSHPYGATSPGRDRQHPKPALRVSFPASPMALPRPDLDRLTATDPPFARVVEDRKSVRQHGADPLSVEQLGELLFRVARVRRVIEPNSGDPTSFTMTDRPYPSGGATYDLEVYLTVHRCVGLEPGLYHYDPLAHAVRLVREPSPETAALLTDATQAAYLPGPPQVLVTLASRFGRVAWRYSSMAHALTLKNVGVLQQTFCLAATAMGLGACPLGGGNSDAFAAAAGTNYYEETSVGELILGSLPDETSRARP